MCYSVWNKARLENRDATFIRAGLSANASIILEKADKVLAIKESLVQFDKKTQKPYVEIETASQKFQRRDLVLGVSDGIYVQVKSGLAASDKIKIWNRDDQWRRENNLKELKEFGF